MSAQPDPIDAPENFQAQALTFLVWGSPEQWWSLEDLVHRIGDPIAALDALSVLEDNGLIHRQDKFVFPTRAALHYHHLFE
jgi:hypothetical protein